MGVAYVSATFGALVTALGLKAALAGRASPLIQVCIIYFRFEILNHHYSKIP